MALDNHTKYDLAMQLNSAVNPDTETEFGIMRYRESTQTYYSDDDMAKQCVRQITKQDVKNTEIKHNLDECFDELKKHLEPKKKNQWRSSRGK